MEASKLNALFLIFMLFVSSAAPILACPSCGKKPPPKKHHPKPKGPITVPPIIKPPVIKVPPIKPPVTIPPIVKPPVVIPPVVKPPVTIPPITIPPVIPPIVKPPVEIPPIVKPPVVIPPIVKPPVEIPPITTNPPSTGKPCPPPKGSTTPAPPKDTCPIDTLKLGACVDLLGGLVHIGLGDPAVNECCPVLAGLAELEAAVCLCTTLKVKLLNLNIFVPIALQLLVTCGKSPPPGFTCSI